MNVSNDTITLQDIQIAANRLNAAMVEAAPKVQLFLEALGWGIRSLLEEAERSSQVRDSYAVPLIVDHVKHPQVTEVQGLHRPLLPSDQPGKGEFWPSQR